MVPLMVLIAVCPVWTVSPDTVPRDPPTRLTGGLHFLTGGLFFAFQAALEPDRRPLRDR